MICREDGELVSPPVWADFQAKDRDGRILLDLPGTQTDLLRWRIRLTGGLKLLLYDEGGDAEGYGEDLVVVGTAIYDRGERRWVAEIDPGDERLVADLEEAEASKYRERRPRGPEVASKLENAHRGHANISLIVQTGRGSDEHDVMQGDTVQEVVAWAIVRFHLSPAVRWKIAREFSGLMPLDPRRTLDSYHIKDREVLILFSG